MFELEITSTWTRLGLVGLSAAGMLVGIIIYIRIIGLRSFSKMSSFDFAVTVAIGSVLGSVTLSNSSLADGLVAVIALLSVQAVIAWLRMRGLDTLVDNDPLLLMAGSRMIDEHLRQARVTAADIRAKLREANVSDYDDVLAVILETTGDISVIHHNDTLEGDLLEGVVGAELVK